MSNSAGRGTGRGFRIFHLTQDVVWERLDSVHNDTTFLRSDLTPFQAPADRDLADRAAVAASLAQAAFASVVPQRHGAPPLALCSGLSTSACHACDLWGLLKLQLPLSQLHS